MCLFLQLSAYSQQQKITVNIKGMPLKEAVQEIAKKSSMNVAYSKEFIDTNKRVSLDVKNTALKDALATLLKGTNIGFRFLDDSILLYNKDYQVADEKGTQQEKQEITISGKVLDESAEPISGVTVSVKGTTLGTITDFDGNYSITVPFGSKLSYSFIGYENVEQVAKKTELNITMAPSSIGLDDVVVVGYGTQKKVNLTGAVSAVKGDVLENRPITSVSSGLQGFLPGVTITSSSGQPGAEANIVIRGTGTINSVTSPLILIDGVAAENINLLNPDDIENVSVLKDAASAAIYGSRAANGVILITTKKGKSKKPSVSYSGYVGMQTPTSLPELVNGRQYMTLQNEAYSAAGFPKPFSSEAFMKYDSGNFPNEYSNTDWIDQVFKKSSVQTGHNVSIGGAAENASYYLSYGFVDQDGLVVGDMYKSKRHNVRMKVNTTILDKLKIDGNLSYVDFFRQDPGRSGTSGVFRLAQRSSPLQPVKWQLPSEDGGFYDSEYWSYGSVVNPVYIAKESGYVKRNTRQVTGILNANMDIIKGLTANAQYSFSYYNNETKTWSPTMPKFWVDGTPDANNDKLKNQIKESRKSMMIQTFTTAVSYDKKIGDHDFKLMAGYSNELTQTPTLSASRKNIPIDGVEELNAATDEAEWTMNGTREHWALMSYFGRINYALKDRYLFEANVRHDGTSRFRNDIRWGTFPSVSVGWRFTEEKFMDFSRSVLDMGKVRASWGELGNQDLGQGYYPYLVEIGPVTGSSSYPIGGKENVGFKQSTASNKDLKWETTQVLDLGLDFTLLNNRLELTFDWYKKNTKDAILTITAPSAVGFSGSNSALVNMGEIENKGYEISATWRDKIGEVKYSLTGNISDVKNEIKTLGKAAPVWGDKVRAPGLPINAYYGYMTDGLAQVGDFGGYDNTSKKYVDPNFPLLAGTQSAGTETIQPGDIKYRDISGPDGIPDGIVNDYDKTVIGNPHPRYTFSLKGTIDWRNFDFSFFLQGVGEVDGYLDAEARHAFINDYSVPKTAHLDRWTPNNPGASYPRMFYGQSHNLVSSSYWIEDASYLRLKNIQLGYTLPTNLIKKAKINKARVYVTMENLLTLSKYFGGFDPEVRETSGDAYPQVKSFVFGVNLTF